ncbi:MAG TPA: peptidoglycan bridge formation glycyltransferase FemA/FemB family protein [Bacteroidales bacterium]|nr:peptidoglycan bridge formation glycyltransferase FemA/FemB family protein [Bacteroidales bacterium]HQP14613.1 peptidoglycan bridge formation glycyltransferase FemA/FemB family protein [Bacteroidales bacterium]
MKLIKSLNEINLRQDDFPFLFWDIWLKYETTANCSTYLYFDEEYDALLPFKIHKLKFLRKADFIYIPLNTKGISLQEDVEKSFLERFHNFIKKENLCDVIFPPTHCCVFKSIPHKCLFFELGIISIDLSPSLDDIFSNINTTYRKQIRKAAKLGLKTVFGPETFQDFYSLYADTHQRQKISYEKENTVRNLVEMFPDNILCGISVREDNTPEHSNLSVYDKLQGYSFWGGSTTSPLVPGSNKFLMWGSIKALKSFGVKKYILGGYRDPDINDEKHNGIQEFKLRFGARVETGYHFIKIINPTKYYLFAIALKIKSFLKGKKYYFINTTGLNIRKSK